MPHTEHSNHSNTTDPAAGGSALDRSTANAAERRVHILLVDDNRANLLALAEILAPLGEILVQATSGREALRCLLDHRFALILMDVQMPEMNGYELAALIRTRDASRHTPIIFLTAADASEVAAFTGYHAGAVDFLHKPVRAEVLRAKVSAFVAMAKWTQQLEEEVASNSRVQQLLHRANEEAESQLDEERHLSHRREAFLQAVLESLTDAVVACDAQGDVTYFNGAARPFVGHASLPVRFDQWSNACFVYGADGTTPLRKEERPLIRALRGEAVRDTELVVTAADGTPRRLLVNGQPMLDADGAQAGGVITIHDITEHHRAEEALRDSQALFRDFMDYTPALAFIRDSEGRTVYVNAAYEQFFRRALEDLHGNTLDAVVPPTAAARLRALYGQVLSGGGPLQVRETIPDPDGKEHECEFYLFPIAGSDGQARLGGIALDVSEQRVLEQQLRQAQKMEAIGRLAGGIAHDFNNMLAVIGGYSEMLHSSQEVPAVAREWAAEIHRAADRAAGLTRQLLAFSRRQVLAPKVLDVNSLVADVERMLRRLIGEDVRLETELHPAPCPVLIDPIQLEQVLMNLAVNARDAMPSGGDLTIRTELAQVDEVKLLPQFVLQPGTYVQLSVRDTGTGMSAEVQAQLFEPFFTTKELGRGTGLGLATVYGIIKQSGGGIQIESAPGAGATFTIYLPCHHDEPDDASKRLDVVRTDLDRGAETILLVEDQEQVRQVVRSMLEAAGYTVLEAADGNAALELADRHTGPIHLLLTDVVMPGMSGPELASALDAARPNMKVLYMSGYTDDTVVHQDLLTAERFLIQKPFPAVALTRKVRALLDGAS